mgnify:CR=1 FL=1
MVKQTINDPLSLPWCLLLGLVSRCGGLLLSSVSRCGGHSAGLLFGLVSHHVGLLLSLACRCVARPDCLGLCLIFSVGCGLLHFLFGVAFGALAANWLLDVSKLLT